MEDILTHHLDLSVSEQGQVLADIKLLYTRWQYRQGIDLTSKTTELVAEALVKEMAKEWLDEGWNVPGEPIHLAPGKYLWKAPRKNKASRVFDFHYPKDRQRILENVEKLFMEYHNKRKSEKRSEKGHTASNLDDIRRQSVSDSEFPELEELFKPSSTLAESRNNDEGKGRAGYPAGHIRSPRFTAINREPSRRDNELQPTPSPISASSTPTKKRKAKGPKTPAVAKKPRVLNPTVEDCYSDGENAPFHSSTTEKNPEPNIPKQPKASKSTKEPRVRSPTNQESLLVERVVSSTGSAPTSSELLSPHASAQKSADLPNQTKKTSKEPSSPVISAAVTLPATPESIKKPKSLAGANPVPVTLPTLSTTTKDISAAVDDKDCLTPDSLMGTENINLSSHRHSLTSPVGRSLPANPSPPSPSTHIWILESSHPRLSWRRWDDQSDQPFSSQDVSGFFARVRKHAGTTDVKQVEITIVMAVQQWTFNVAWSRGQEFQEMKKFMLDQIKAAREEGSVNIYVRPCERVGLNGGLDDSLYEAD